MENNIDKITKEILAPAKLELTNPDFDRTVMYKIMLKVYRKRRQKMLLLVISILVLILSSQLIIIRNSNFDLSALAGEISNFPFTVSAVFSKLFQWVIEHQYFILPLIAILVVKKIIDSRVKYG